MHGKTARSRVIPRLVRYDKRGTVKLVPTAHDVRTVRFGDHDRHGTTRQGAKQVQIDRVGVVELMELKHEGFSPQEFRTEQDCRVTASHPEPDPRRILPLSHKVFASLAAK